MATEHHTSQPSACADDRVADSPQDVSRRAWLRKAARATAAGAIAVSLPGLAQTGRYPERPITLIVPWAAGGNTDGALRALAEALGRILGGARILVENKPGGGGALGAQHMAQFAKPDGYTIGQTPLGVFRLPYLIKTNFHPINDLTYIICVAGYNFALSVRGDAPWKTWQEFIADAKANPDKIRYSSPGIGTSLHITMDDIALREGIKWIQVPYKGGNPSIQALLGGEVDAMAGSPPWGMVEAGRIRPLTVWSEKRTPRAPDVPTLKELYGITANSPWGIAGPKGMDPGIVKLLHDSIRKAMDDKLFLQALDRYGQEVYYMSSEQYTAFAKSSFEKEKEVVERLGLAKKS